MIIIGLLFSCHLKAQTKEVSVSVLSVALPTTTSIMLSIEPKIGTMVYNTNSNVEGTVSYPAIGKGLYSFDGNGWLAIKPKAIPATKSTIDLPQFSNAILLIDKGTFTPPSPMISGGNYYFIRNTSTDQTVYVSNIIDFGAVTPKMLSLSPLQGSVLIYCNGENWFKIL